MGNSLLISSYLKVRIKVYKVFLVWDMINSVRVTWYRMCIAGVVILIGGFPLFYLYLQ